MKSLWDELQAHDVHLSAIGDRLHVDAPSGFLTPVVRNRISVSKAELLGLMRGDLPAALADWPEEWRECYEERAAIMEYDGRLPREEAEHRAQELVRESFRRTGGCSIARGAGD